MGGEDLWTKKLTYGLLGGLIGAVIVLLLTGYAVNNRNYGMMSMMGMGRGVSYMMRAEESNMNDAMESMMHGEKGGGMDAMVSELVSLEGAEFDRRFIELMIEHHQGAIDMANSFPAEVKDRN